MIESPRIYDGSLPLFAIWSLESPIFTAVVFIQSAGNETRVIASQSWKLKALHQCLEDVAERVNRSRMRVRLHVTPPDPDLIYLAQFEDQGLIAEAAPALHDNVTLTRRLMSTLRIHPEGNDDLIESINQYAPRQEPHGYIVTAGHTSHRFFVRALEILAAWQHAGGGQALDQWGPAPDYTLSDRARI